MNAALSLFVVALLGAEQAPHSGASAVQYRVKLLEMDGLKWRESLYTQLQPVARHGTNAIWTAKNDVIKPLVDQASRVLLSPQVVAEPGAVASYTQRTNRKVASGLTRHADGPVDHAVAVAYTTDHENLGEGCQFTMAGRKLDQGMLVKLVVEELRVAAVHQVKLTEFVSKRDGHDGGVTINPQLDVPEVLRATLEGEWLIPNSGVLVASLGVHTLDDGHGKAIVREHLILVEASPVAHRTTVDFSQVSSRAFTYVAPARSATIPMPARVPAVPSRTLPMARNAEGAPVPLPPLPESQVPPTSLPGSSEPCATPQTSPNAKGSSAEDDATPADKKDETEPGSLDSESVKAGYQSELKATGTTTASSFVPWSALKPYLLRLPLGPGVEIEISAKVTPTTKP